MVEQVSHRVWKLEDQGGAQPSKYTMPWHTVEQGETLFSLAEASWLRDWGEIWERPENSGLAQQQREPGILMPRDRVLIPNRELKQEPSSVDQSQTFRVSRATMSIRLAIKDSLDKPCEGKRCELQIGDEIWKGSLPATGILEQKIPVSAQEGMVKIWLEGESEAPVTWNLKIGHLDPIVETTGIQARLNNLGFAAGPVDGIVGPITRAAVKRFQTRYELDVDGIAGPVTQAKLKQVYGC